ncbi:MAG: hypothetical protein LBU64_14510 [Planctomycetota bacterium]|jgi:tetratricopeptide (TPR) repeat protein|nr:hypothetical protein [Planctomycetota bacterium]
MTAKLGRGFLVALFLCAAAAGIGYRLLVPAGGGGDGAEELAKQARDALEAVKNRDLTPSPSLRVTATYDAILAPLDRLLRLAENILEGETAEPVADYERIRSLAEPVIEISLLAREQSRRETGAFRKDYRFMEQRGEACRLLATALWNRLEALHGNSAGRDGSRFVPGAADSEKLYALVKDGLDSDPANKSLWYLRSLVERANGVFGRAEGDLRKALSLDSRYVAAWNDLGLVLIRLGRFEEAGEAFAQAKDRAAEAARLAGRPVGADYAAALLNLAEFHLDLADSFRREIATDPANRDNQDRLGRHLTGAAEAVRELLANMPAESPEAIEGRKLLSRITY